MKVAIVDDLSADRTQLKDYIIKYSRENAKENIEEITITEYESGNDFLNLAPLSEIDVVFMDIYMEGISGMEAAYEIRRLNQPCNIVFVTTSSAFAVQSYDVGAFYYILKPYAYENIEKVMNMLNSKLKKFSEYIKVKEGREWCKVLLTDILYADYSNHYVQIHTESAIISTYMKFSEIEEKLLVYKEFLSCYRCILVNMNKIKKVDDLFFLLSNGEYIPINRKRVKEIKTSYMDFIFGTLEEGTDNDD